MNGRKILLLVVFAALAAGVYLYVSLKKSSPAAKYSPEYGEGVPMAVASVEKMAETEQRPEKHYKLPPDAGQEALLKELLKTVSSNVAVSELKEADWDFDWSDNPSAWQNVKTLYKDNELKDRVMLQSWLLGSPTDFREVVLSGSLRVCRQPVQASLLEVLRSEGFEITVPTAPVHGFGSNYWRSVYGVRRGSLTGLTYYVVPTGVTGCLELFLKDRKIESAVPLKDFSFNAMFPPALPPKLISDLESGGTAKLVPDWAKAKEIAVSTGVLYARDLEVLARAYSAVSTSTAGEEQGAVVSVFKAHLIMQLFIRGSYYETNPNEGGGGKPFRKIMDENGVKYFESHYGGVFSEKQFGIDIYERSPGSYWGQYAFLRHLAGGYGSDDFDYGLRTDQPIKLGGEFLEKHPDSPFYTDVLFLVGRAYETLYEQGFSAESCDQYAGKPCAELVAGQEQNRVKALEIYAAVPAAPGGAKYKEFIDGIVPRLKTRGKTYCYQFFPRSD